MFFSAHVSSNMHPSTTFFDFAAQMQNLAVAQTKQMMRAQFAVADFMTLGLLTQARDELENALVEGVEIGEEFLIKFHQLQTQALSEQERHFEAQNALADAEFKIKNTLQSLAQNLFTLPFSHTLEKPSKKRFPVTLEGEVVRDLDATQN